MMKLLAIAAASLTAVLLAVSVVRAANDGNQDFAVGGFERSNAPTNGGHTGFSAQSGPNGQAVNGQVTSTFDSSPNSGAPGIKQRWNVVCLAVSGHDASMGLVPRNAPPSNAADIRGLTVHDGGPGGTLDTYGFWTGDDPNNCAAHLTAADAPNPPLHGNITVHDEP